jgi:hypothetical protein
VDLSGLVRREDVVAAAGKVFKKFDTEEMPKEAF